MNMNDIEFAKYLIEQLAPDLREAGQTFTADDVNDAGARLLHAAEIARTYDFYIKKEEPNK
tara:strand:- start:517 stop:699 length:183 start_codon:yes stop_codon:yes gene_type:complete